MDCSPPDSTVQGESPGKNTGVGYHVLLQGIFLTQGLNPCLLCLLHWQVGFLPLVTPGKPSSSYTCVIIWSVSIAPWRQRQWLVLFIFISSVPGLVLSHGRHSTNVMSECPCIGYKEESLHNWHFLSFFWMFGCSSESIYWACMRQRVLFVALFFNSPMVYGM